MMQKVDQKLLYVLCPLTGSVALELHNERLSDERLFLLVLMLTRHTHRLGPVWRAEEVQMEEEQNFCWIQK